MSFYNNSSPSISTIGLGTKSANLDNNPNNIQNNNQYNNDNNFQNNNNNDFQNNNNNNFQNTNNNNIQNNNGNIIQNNKDTSNNFDNGIQNSKDDNVQYRNSNNNNLQSGSLSKVKYSLPSDSINQSKGDLSPGLIAIIVVVPLVVVFVMLLICRRFSSRTSKLNQTSSGQRAQCEEVGTSRGIGNDSPDGETRSDRIRRMMLGGRNRRHSRSDSLSTVPEYSLNPIESEMTISSSELNSNSAAQTSLFSRFMHGLHSQSSSPTPPPPVYEINSSQSSEPRSQLNRTATETSSTGSTSTSRSSIFTFSSSTHSPKSITRSNTVSNLPSLDQQSIRTDQRNEDHGILHDSNLSQLEQRLEGHPSRTALPSLRPLDEISPLTSFINLNNTLFSPSPPFTGQSNPNHSTVSIH